MKIVWKDTIINSDASIDTLYIDFGIILFLISIMSLFPYAYHTIENLKPEKMIQKVHSKKYLIPLMYHAISTENQYILDVGLNKLVINKEFKYETFLKCFGIISMLEKYSFEKNSEESIITISKFLEDRGMQTINVIKESRKREIDIIYAAEEISSIIEGTLFDYCNKSIDRTWRRATKSILDSIGNLIAYTNIDSSNKVFNISNLTEEFVKSKTKDERIFLEDYFIETIIEIQIKIWRYKYYLHLNFDEIKNMNENIYLAEIRKILEISDKHSKHLFNLIGEKGISFAREYRKHETIFICLCLKEIGVSYCSNNEQKLESISNLFIKIYKCYDKALAEPNWKEELIGVTRSLLNKIGLISDFGFHSDMRLYFPFRQEIDERIDERMGKLSYIRKSDMIDVTKTFLDIYEELFNSIKNVSKRSLKILFYSLIVIYSNNKDNETIKTQISSTFKKIVNKIEDEELIRISFIELREKISFESDLRDFLKFCCLRYVFWL